MFSGVPGERTGLFAPVPTGEMWATNRRRLQCFLSVRLRDLVPMPAITVAHLHLAWLQSTPIQIVAGPAGDPGSSCRGGIVVGRGNRLVEPAIKFVPVGQISVQRPVRAQTPQHQLRDYGALQLECPPGIGHRVDNLQRPVIDTPRIQRFTRIPAGPGRARRIAVDDQPEYLSAHPYGHRHSPMLKPDDRLTVRGSVSYQLLRKGDCLPQPACHSHRDAARIHCNISFAECSLPRRPDHVQLRPLAALVCDNRPPATQSARRGAAADTAPIVWSRRVNFRPGGVAGSIRPSEKPWIAESRSRLM